MLPSFSVSCQTLPTDVDPQTGADLQDDADQRRYCKQQALRCFPQLP